MTIIDNSGIGVDDDGAYAVIDGDVIPLSIVCKDGYLHWCHDYPANLDCDLLPDRDGNPIPCVANSPFPAGK